MPCMGKYMLATYVKCKFLKITTVDLGYRYNLLFISKQIVCAVTFLCNTGNITDVI